MGACGLRGRGDSRFRGRSYRIAKLFPRRRLGRHIGHDAGSRMRRWVLGRSLSEARLAAR
jgi:hypothetical protein